MMLDLDSVRFFVLTVDCGNLTRAAEAAGTVQPVVSQKLKALETQLGRKLLERTPRLVRLTSDGADFLVRARALLAAHDDALNVQADPPLRFSIGASDHALGLGLEAVLRRVRQTLPANARIDVRTGLSQTILTGYLAGDFDVAIIRREGQGGDGEVLGHDPMGWRGDPGLNRAGSPLPLALLAAPCGVRASAIKALDQAGRPWREAFSSGGCAAVLAAARAGIGLAPMGRAASGDMDDAGPALGLPPLKPSEIVLFARAGSRESAIATRALTSAVRAALSQA